MVFVISIVQKLFIMYKLRFYSFNNLKYSYDVSRTKKKTIKGTKRQDEYLFTSLKSKQIL